MTDDVLAPRLDLLRQEYVLVQAWKKTASYIRHHNWFSDTLELDRTTVNLPQFLAEMAQQLNTPERWTNDQLRTVPAPKSQQWRVTPDTKRWEPVNVGETAARLRPLAHVSLKDQVAATAIMLCLADRVETIQGNPSASIAEARNRKRVVAYGNRLFCDARGQELRHRWGSAKLYRAYYQDYRSFLSRPEIAAEAVFADGGSRVVIVHSDLRQFYDRVRPEHLIQKIDALKSSSDDPRFYAFARRLLNWEWDKRDFPRSGAVRKTGWPFKFLPSRFATRSGGSGLFRERRAARTSNKDYGRRYLRRLIRGFVSKMHAGMLMTCASSLPSILRRACLRLSGSSLNGFDNCLTATPTDYYQPKAGRHGPPMLRGDERPLVRQSRKMARIQGTVSGGFDAIGGEEILDAVQGLVRSQQRYSEQRAQDQGWPLLPIPDVRDATVARFAAWRFRNTFRSLRPLLAGRDPPVVDQEGVGDATAERSRVARTRAELDDEARAFALGLIENWVQDPSNVRLLRIGLDLWPADDVLRSVLELLRPFTEKGGRRKAPRRVAWYCLSEIFRAGVTETGFVEDDKSLPDLIDIAAYRSMLRKEAVRLASLPAARLPWYLKQQLYLFLAANDPTQAPINRTGHSSETRHYRELIRYLRGEGDGLTGADFATLAILSRRSFLGMDTAVQLVGRGITGRRLEQIAERDPSFGLEILASRSDLLKEVSPRTPR